MKERYESGQSNVIQAYAGSIRSHGLNLQQKQLHDFFSFRLASARSNYLSHFLQKYDLERAVLKKRWLTCSGRHIWLACGRISSRSQTSSRILHNWIINLRKNVYNTREENKQKTRLNRSASVFSFFLLQPHLGRGYVAYLNNSTSNFSAIVIQ